ncbi:MAG: metallophosphoesterase [Chloroflexota bacterium]
MRFVHITDTHIGPTPQYRVQGQLALPTLEALVRTINDLPFEPDFILHTGDIADDGSEAAYALARPVLQQLKAPIFYLLGNHDRPKPMQQVLLSKSTVAQRYDYYVKLNGFGLAVFDSRGPTDPAGTLTANQLNALRDLCQPSGPPLIIALHHQPVALDVEWLDNGWGESRMQLDCAEEFLKAIAPARDRIRGVFFGHVHRSCQVIRDGILFSTPPSSCAQILAWPTQHTPIPSPDELPGFNVVTVLPDQTIIRQHTFLRS